MQKFDKPDAEIVYDAYADMLFRIALTHLQNSHDAQDALHEVFLKYIKAPATFFRDETHLKAWLIRVTCNQCNDMHRRQKNRPTVSLDEIEEPECDDNAAAAAAAADLMHQLEALPEKYRMVIVLHCLEGLSVEETASMLSVTVSAVKMRLSRARDLLNESLKGGRKHDRQQ